MILLGIDPGSITAGFGILKKENNKVILLESGSLCMKSSQPLQERIALFYNFFKEKIESCHIDHIALETPFLGKNAQNFLKLGYLRGTLYLLAEQYKLTLYEFSPSEVKLSITGYGSADKEQVARVLLRLFPGLAQPKKLDETDALAVALCGIKQHSRKFIY